MIEFPTNISLLIEQSVNIIKNKDYNLRFSPEERDFLCENFQKKKIKKDSFLTHSNHINNCLYFVEKGILRHWISTEENNSADKELTFWFSLPGDFIDQTYLTSIKNKGINHIQAVCDSIVWEIDKLNFMHICDKSLNLNKVLRTFERKTLKRLFRKEIRSLELSAEKHYSELISEHEYFLQHIPLQYIASYIGITPQSLSRIRKNIFKK